ncbi:protein spaetzle-like isoform X3 [Venturia canescens]|uniref:protein spaetzle-like isoform X3 n=1 Tax=Venturia canescens TaxID=32260 RepID=UPI001C9D53C1|nr:protein spaetzle-like isoform X3 [Venturia canescens]
MEAEYDGKNFNSNGKTISPLIPSDSTMVQQKLDDFSPDPCENANFCENPSFYPEDLIREALKHRNDLKYSTVVDPMPDKNGTDTGEQDVLCQTKISLVYPRMAKNRANESLFIVNDDFFRQGVYIEVCRNTDSPCGEISDLLPNYKTSCKQRYIYRKLVVVNSTGFATSDYFSFPANCCCHVSLKS